MYRTPVRDNKALETPLFAQYLSQQPVVLRAVNAVHLVVGAHHRPRLGELHHPLERRQIDLPQGALVDLCANPKSIILLVVCGIVLQRRTNPLALGALDHRGREFCSQPRILGDIFEISPAQWRPFHVDPRPEHDRYA